MIIGATGKRLTLIHRVVDRMNNWYSEKIVDEKTGEVVIDKTHPLSDHREHGSAKRSSDRSKDP